MTKEKNIQDFSDLLEKISNLDDKMKFLWRQIYVNALEDREIAHSQLVMLNVICTNKSSEHAVHGRTISSFIERMSKANDQLIRLSEMVKKQEEKESEINEDDIFNKIGDAQAN